jgi:hypothetical protein
VRVVLDTSILISSWQPEDDDEYAVSIVSLAEMHFGVLKASGSPELAVRVRRLSEVESEFDPIPVDHRVALSYARCAGAVNAVGRSPSPRVCDLLIAATAHVEEATLYTLNPADFRGLEQLVEVVRPTV